MLNKWNTNFSEEMLAFFGEDATVHAPDERNIPQVPADGPPIRVIRQPERQGDVTTFKSIYREPMTLATNDLGNAAQGKFIRLDNEYWHIGSVNQLGWGWVGLSVVKGDTPE